MLKSKVNLTICLIVFFLLFFFTHMGFAGTYIYYTEKGEKIAYKAKNLKVKTTTKQKKRQRENKGKPAGIPFEHKNKKNKRLDRIK